MRVWWWWLGVGWGGCGGGVGQEGLPALERAPVPLPFLAHCNRSHLAAGAMPPTMLPACCSISKPAAALASPPRITATRALRRPAPAYPQAPPLARPRALLLLLSRRLPRLRVRHASGLGLPAQRRQEGGQQRGCQLAHSGVLVLRQAGPSTGQSLPPCTHYTLGASFFSTLSEAASWHKVGRSSYSRPARPFVSCSLSQTLASAKWRRPLATLTSPTPFHYRPAALPNHPTPATPTPRLHAALVPTPACWFVFFVDAQPAWSHRSLPQVCVMRCCAL